MESPFEKILKDLYPQGKKIGQEIVGEAKIVFETPFVGVAGVTLKEDSVRVFDIILAQPGVGALVITDDEKVILVQNTRIGAQTFNWEIPQETVELKEIPEKTVKRALTEELGYSSDVISMTPLPFRIHAAPHRFTEVTQVFLTRIASYKQTNKIDTKEIHAIKAYPLDTIEELIKNGVVTESVTLVSLHWLLLHKDLL